MGPRQAGGQGGTWTEQGTLPVSRNFRQGLLFCSSSKMAAASARRRELGSDCDYGRALPTTDTREGESASPSEKGKGMTTGRDSGRGSRASGDLSPTQPKARTGVRSDLSTMHGGSPGEFFLSPVIRWFQRRQWHPTPVLLPGESHGWRSLVGCSPWGR